MTAHRAHCSCPGAASGLQALQGQPQPRPRSSTGQQCSATWCGDWLSLPPCTCPASYFLLAFVLKLRGSQWEGDRESASLPSPDFGLGLQNDFSPSIQGVTPSLCKENILVRLLLFPVLFSDGEPQRGRGLSDKIQLEKGHLTSRACAFVNHIRYSLVCPSELPAELLR